MDQKRCYGCMNMRSAQGYVCEHCGYDERRGNKPDQLRIGTLLLDQYLVGRVLGQGGFGITYMGWDTALNTPVAIKEFYPAGCVTRIFPGSAQLMVTNLAASDWIYNSMEKFIQEARTLAQFSGESEIVHVRNVFRTNGTAYIIMEFVKGTTLKDYVRSKGGRLSARETLDILRPVINALDRVHQAGVIHRDISPDNIMILPDGKTKLLDFGAARVLRNADGRGPANFIRPVVKPGFAPVEQYSNDEAQGPFTDVYALCATMYYCMAGSIPMDAPVMYQTGNSVNWNSIPGLSKDQISALEQGMELQVSKRTQTVHDLSEKLYTNKKFNLLPPVKFPWKAAAMIAAVMLVFGFAWQMLQSVGGKGESGRETEPTMQMHVSSTTESMEIPAPAESEPVETVSATIPPVVSPDAWKDNVLAMQNQEHIPAGEAESIAFGTGVKRKDIKTVTCLEYLNMVPNDAVDVSMKQDGSVLAWVVPNGEMYDLYIGANGGINAGTDCKALFAFFVNAESINLGTALHTDNVETMRCMFQNCSSLKELNLSNQNTEKVNHMGSMFSGCLGLKCLDLSTFKTGNVTDMGWMFSGCSSLNDVKLDSFDTSKVTHMGGMFYGCSSLEKLDLSGFDTGNVIAMTNMFYECSKLVSIEAEHFNTSKVKSMDKMFRYCTVFQTDEVANWDYSSVVWSGDFMDPDKTVNGKPWSYLFYYN